MRPHPKRARTDPTRPSAWATSDRSGFVGNQENLRWQYEYRGTELINTRILVYPEEYDEPQRQLGTIILPPDPVSIMNARPEQYPVDETTAILLEVPAPANLPGGLKDGGGFAGNIKLKGGRIQSANQPVYLEGTQVEVVLELGNYYNTA